MSKARETRTVSTIQDWNEAFMKGVRIQYSGIKDSDIKYEHVNRKDCVLHATAGK